MSAHTPGPWRAVPIVRGRWAGKRFDVAGMGFVAGNVQPQDVPLILAAPDLLAACKALEAWVSRATINDEGPSYPKEAHEARAAIARAEGKP